MIPDALHASLSDALTAAGDSTPVRSIDRVGGGDINEAARVVTGRREYFVKWNLRSLPRLFEVEARGLRLLQSARAVRVPEVVAVIEQPPSLLLEWIDARGSKAAAGTTLGRQLAQQHRLLGATYGLDHDNYIGANPQINRPAASWIDFFRDHRLGFQIDLARSKGRLNPKRALLLDRLSSRLDEWIDEARCAPSLLHGDLWGGNFITGPDGEPVLIDPAVYYGDREAEIAFTELFGGFGQPFYAAYNEAWPLAPGYAERRELYNLYHLLNHLNLFGEGYGGSVDAILRSYVGKT
jgi:fructosamine-3-kinase